MKVIADSFLEQQLDDWTQMVANFDAVIDVCCEDLQRAGVYLDWARRQREAALGHLNQLRLLAGRPAAERLP